MLLATLFNLITDLVGGIRFSVLEEEVRTRDERGIEQAVYDPSPITVGESDAAEPLGPRRLSTERRRPDGGDCRLSPVEAAR